MGNKPVIYFLREYDGYQAFTQEYYATIAAETDGSEDDLDETFNAVIPADDDDTDDELVDPPVEDKIFDDDLTDNQKLAGTTITDKETTYNNVDELRGASLKLNFWTGIKKFLSDLTNDDAAHMAVNAQYKFPSWTAEHRNYLVDTRNMLMKMIEHLEADISYYNQQKNSIWAQYQYSQMHISIERGEDSICKGFEYCARHIEKAIFNCTTTHDLHHVTFDSLALISIVNELLTSDRFGDLVSYVVKRKYPDASVNDFCLPTVENSAMETNSNDTNTADKLIAPPATEETDTSVNTGEQDADIDSEITLEDSQTKIFKYYLKQRRPIFGAVPSGFVKAENGEVHVPIIRPDGSIAGMKKLYFGTVIYNHPLTEEQISDYDLGVDPFNSTDNATNNANDKKNISVDNNSNETALTDDFDAKIVELKADLDRKSIELDKANAELFKARELAREAEQKADKAEDAKFKAKFAWLQALSDKSKALTATLITPDIIYAKNFKSITIQKGNKISAFSFFAMRISNYGKGWEINSGFVTYGKYDNTAQVTAVINRLKDAIKRGDTEFKFSTVEELIKPPEVDNTESDNPTPTETKKDFRDRYTDSLIHAMKINLEKFQEFCRVKNLVKAQNEMKLYTICSRAMSKLWATTDKSLTNSIPPD